MRLAMCPRKLSSSAVSRATSAFRLATSASFGSWGVRAIDGGEELGLSGDFLDVADWYDNAQRQPALQKVMQFHWVPRSNQPAVSALVTPTDARHPGCVDV